MITDKFITTYQILNKNNLNILDEIYAEEVTFIDPFHKIKSLNKTKIYFSELYQNVLKISFDFEQVHSTSNDYFLPWKMTLTHPKLNKGNSFVVPGITHLKTNKADKIIYHRDYFDAGTMLYERLPLFGKVINWIKRKL